MVGAGHIVGSNMGTKTSRFHPSKQQGGGARDEGGALVVTCCKDDKYIICIFIQHSHPSILAIDKFKTLSFHYFGK
jgi:hypothetical protein